MPPQPVPRNQAGHHPVWDRPTPRRHVVDREITLVAVDTGISAFPHFAQLNQCTRNYCSAQKGNEPEVAVRRHGTSHEFGSKTATQLATMIRELWRVEILDPWKRDASSWQKEQATQRNPRGAQNLAPIRDALLAVIPFADEGFESLNDAFDY